MYTALLSILLVVASSCTIVPDEKKAKDGEKKLDIYFVNDDFNPEVFVDEIWADKVVAYFRQNCLEIDTVLKAWKEDREAAGTEFGHREKQEGSPWTFKVTGTGKVIGVNTKSRASTIDVDLAPGDGVADVIIQIGPVIKDSSVRDALEFISFTDFTNQLEFARLSNALNKKINQEVLSSLDRESLLDRAITFHGAFTQLQDSDLVRITPVILDVE